MTDRTSPRVAATLLLIGQILYIVVTLFHADGEANNHPAVFAEYVASGSWTLVHLGQFLSMAVLIAGLCAFIFAVDTHDDLARWTSRFAAGSALAALTLYGALQAVDGIANKQADIAWVSAPSAEKAARFASAEAVRWIEWGMRSYHDVALGVALLLFAVAAARTGWIPRPIGYLIGISGLTAFAQGWIVGAEGFSHSESIAIVITWGLNVTWMIWLMVVSSRAQASER